MSTGKFIFNVRRVIGIRGRITIPYHIRETLGIKYNDVLSFSVSEEPKTITITKLDICNNCNEKVIAESRMKEFKSFLKEFSDEELKNAFALLEKRYKEGEKNENLKNSIQ